MQKPSVGRVVHYVARGSADGKFPSVCRAAIVTEVSDIASKPIVSLAVLNPTGVFFDINVAYDEQQAPGTWHWPERVD
ncbi:MAG: hypothetical protein ACM3UO_00115 [Bacillota bacterium]